jgi:glycosyltransferase involved in cell wall biosynthesis
MRVLQTPVRFAPSIGGVETYVHSLSRELVRAGHEVSVVCARPEVRVPTLASIDGIEVHRLRSVGSIANTNLTPGLPVALLRELRRADVVHTHLPTPWSADVSAHLGLVADCPVVVTYHNDIVGAGLAGRVADVYNRTVLRSTLAIADRILVTQPAYVDRSPHLEPVADKVTVVSNGVDTDLFAPTALTPDRREALGFAADRHNLFFLSVLDSFHDYKGLDVLFQALAEWRAAAPGDEGGADDRVGGETGSDDEGDGPAGPPRGPRPHLVVGGDGDARSRYEASARESGLAEDVTFVGRLSTPDLVAAYNAADAFVLPSTDADQEGFGLVLLEALSCGSPVVCTDVVGVADDVRTHDLGAVVPPGDVDALADGLARVLGRTEFDADAARALCRDRYSWRAKAAEILEVYRAVGADGGDGRDDRNGDGGRSQGDPAATGDAGADGATTTESLDGRPTDE